ncbi:MAG: hypothetical protein O7D36_04965 [Gammaproteobacteria bacterium]|nr:hypothetical protein [Gammaproteobacteria bacterium]
MATTQAARVGGLETTIYLPKTISPLKHSNMTRLGAKKILVSGNGVEEENVGRTATGADKIAGRSFSHHTRRQIRQECI